MSLANIRKCEHCAKLFAPKPYGAGSILCAPCAVESGDHYMEVYRFIRKQGFISLYSVAEGTHVPEPLIKGLMLDGRFESTGNNAVNDLCERQRKQNLLNLMSTQPAATAAPKPATVTPTRKSSYGLGR